MSLEQIARDIAAGTFPKKSERTLQEEASARHIQNSANSVQIGIHAAWPALKAWLASFVWEEQAFSRYRDDVLLDGIMTAGQARQLAEIFRIKPEYPADPPEDCEPLSDDDKRMIDQAWETHKATLPVARVVDDNQPGRTAIIEISKEPPTLAVGTKLYAAPVVSKDSADLRALIARASEALYMDNFGTWKQKPRPDATAALDEFSVVGAEIASTLEGTR